MYGLILEFLNKGIDMNQSISSDANTPDLQHKQVSRPKWHVLWMKTRAFFHGNNVGIIGATLIAVILIGALFAPVLTSHDPNKRVGRPHVAPNAEHILGTTRNGRDVFSHVLYGAR
jgi:peptide/nickel transport system permease protein